MKAILMSIKPRFVADILNGKKTIEVRKRFPLNYRGWVYIYCTKEDNLFKSYIRMGYYTTRSTADDLSYNGKGKVVARFYVNNVEEIKTDYAPRDTFFEECCLTPIELFDYIGHSKWYAIHISQLEIFDEPKELSEFKVRKNDCPFPCSMCNVSYCQLKKAPQSFMFIAIGD